MKKNTPKKTIKLSTNTIIMIKKLMNSEASIVYLINMF